MLEKTKNGYYLVTFTYVLLFVVSFNCPCPSVSIRISEQTPL